MNNPKKKLLFVSISMSLLSGILFAAQPTSEVRGLDFVRRGKQISDEDVQYLGYGYDVTSGKAVSDPDALSLAYPILDVDNAELRNYAREFSSSLTQYQSYSSKSLSEVAANYGTTLAGGVSGKIQMVTFGAETRFNMQTKWSKTFAEEFSYYSIYAKNRTVLFQTTPETLSTYLHKDFLKAIRNIDEIADADNVFKKYGTHLVTGYDLGGIFELTNYYATSSSSYQRQMALSFDSQVQVAIGAYGGGTNFSFSQEYGMTDNTSVSVNNYKCTTYGGYVFPGLTIDQAFSYYETAFGAGYIYQLWTDSINAGKNLSIISIPKTSEMIPLWSILPESSDYDKARTYLISSYIKLCGISYREFLEKYPDVNGNSAPADMDPADIGYQGLGYEVFTPDGEGNYNSLYVPSDEYKNTINVSAGSIASFDFAESLYKARKLEWKIDNEAVAEVMDDRNGVIRFKKAGGVNISVFLDDVQIYTLDVNVSSKKYSGGAGTEKDPYLISSAADFYEFAHNSSEWTAHKYYKLTNNINITSYTGAEDATSLVISPTKGTAFNGEFDGDGHSIQYGIGKDYLKSSTEGVEAGAGLFGYNKGNITNLTIDHCAIQNYNSTGYLDIINLGGIAGVNEGTIYNCKVKNFYLNYNASAYANDAYIGGIAGKSIEGSEIVQCEVEDLDFEITTDNKVNVFVGGVVGRSESATLKVLSSHNMDTEIYQNGSTDSVVTLAVGGVIGKSFCSISNDSIEDLLYYSDGYDKHQFAIYNNTHYSSNDYVMVGGIIGHDENTKQPTYARFVAYSINEIDIEKTGTKTLKGALVGYRKNAEASTSLQWSKFVDSVFELANDLNAVGNGVDNPGGVTSMEGYLSYSSNDFPEAIKDSDDWTAVDDRPLIVFTSSADYTVDIDVSNAKKTFLLGDSFKAGEIKVSVSDEAGNEIEAENYIVDASRFDSSKEGTYRIYVKVYNYEVSYTVRVLKSKIARIAVSKDPNPREYYAGDLFDPTGMEVALVYEDGNDDTKINPSTDGFEITNGETPLIAGVNLMNIKYTSELGDEFETVYSVEAKRAIVNDVHVTSTQSFRAPMGTKALSPIDLEGLTIEVELERPKDATEDRTYTISFQEQALRKNKVVKIVNGASYEIDVKEVEFIFSPIKKGDNDVKVCVGGYTENSESKINVYGFVAAQAEEHARFKELVTGLYEETFTLDGEGNIISVTHLPLKERYALLSEALRLREELKNNFADDQEFIDLCVDLEILVNLYNNQVRAINDNVAETVLISQAFNYRGLVGGGLVALPLIMAVLALLF